MDRSAEQSANAGLSVSASKCVEELVSVSGRWN